MISDDIFTGELQTVYAENNYDGFKKLLKSQSYGKHLISSMLSRPLYKEILMLCFKTPTKIFKTDNLEKSQFENLLLSKEKKAGKYISLILEHFELGHDELFLKEAKKHGKNYMNLVAETETVEILFSFLMFDWFQPETKSEKSYCLVLKNEQYFKATSDHLITRLMKIVESATTKSFLKEIGVKIIYQIINEIDLTLENISKFQSKIKLVNYKKTTLKKGSKEVVKLEKKLKTLKEQREILVYRVELISDDHKTSFINDAFRMRTKAGIDEKEYFDKILMVLIVSLLDKKNLKYHDFKENVTTSIYTKSYWEFFEAVFLLKEKKVVEFELCFEKWISAANLTSNIEFQTELKLQVQMLSNTAQMQKVRKASEFIFKLYPHIGMNLTLMSIWNSASDFQKYFYSDHLEVEKLVS